MIVGALHVDDIATSRQGLIARASNPVSRHQRVGGVAANAALAAASIGRGGNSQADQHVAFAAAIGTDAVATQLENTLLQAGILPCLQYLPGCMTGRYIAVLEPDGELYIGLSDVALAESLDAAKVPLHTEGYSLSGIVDGCQSFGTLSQHPEQAGQWRWHHSGSHERLASQNRHDFLASHHHWICCSAIAVKPSLWPLPTFRSMHLSISSPTLCWIRDSASSCSPTPPHRWSCTTNRQVTMYRYRNWTRRAVSMVLVMLWQVPPLLRGAQARSLPTRYTDSVCHWLHE